MNQYQNGRIFRLCGNGVAGHGDGDKAEKAAIGGPAGLALDSSGNLYIAEALHHRIRKIAVGSGIITTVAGCGVCGTSGDGGPASAAQLNGPEGVAVSQNGDIWIADTFNHRIRRVDFRTGLLHTMAGNSGTGYNGDNDDARRATLSRPSGIMVDAYGNGYFNDYGCDRVRKIRPDGSICTVTGTGMPGYSGDGGPAAAASVNDVYGLAMDSRNNLYIMDSLNFAVRRVDYAAGTIQTVVGRGYPGETPDFTPTASACLDGAAHTKHTTGGLVPHGIDVDHHGNLYIAETGTRRIRMLEHHSGLLFTIADGNGVGPMADGTPALAGCFEVHGVRVDQQGCVYFNDFSHHTVYRIEPVR